MKRFEPWMQTLSGDSFVLRQPHVTTAMLTGEIATALSRIPRFNGHTIQAYSVAQHSVLCAEAAEDDTGDLELAAFCLLHDAHEAYTGDITTPMVAAIVSQMADGPDDFAREVIGPRRAKLFLTSLERIKGGIDTEVAVAAGLPIQGLIDHRAAIKRIDLRALRTERDDLKAPGARLWEEAVETAERLPVRTGRIRPLPERDARTLFITTLRRLCPAIAAADPAQL
ncbi:HD domain-containing protein [Aureimonas ureilytica]|uniref:HD domain-containing protein n=1 Tax=Aureimonas ureilytica TaxID=401562 RepID=UPI000734093F|nr:HD domain-containing protein [Aureimonas ureilytica]